MPNYLLRSTHQLVLKLLAGQEKVLREDLPQALQQGYQTGGYWHDNALFEASQMDQQVLVSQMGALSAMIDNPVFIEDLEIDGETVSIGTEIVIERENGEDAKQERYLVLGPADARVLDGVLPYTSPLFAAIKGKRAGEQVEATFPGGTAVIRVVSVRPLAGSKAP